MKRALFWGAAWGLAEATAGHVLHVLRVPGLAGFVMVPAGVILMSLAVRDSGRPGAAALASLIAAAFKALDFLLPPADALAVLRPAAAILAEGLSVWILCAALSPRAKSFFRIGQS
jgi:hypothetical protein